MHIRDVQNKKFKNLGIENCPPAGDLPKGEKFKRMFLVFSL
jgi:hypothetical protein